MAKEIRTSFECNHCGSSHFEIKTKGNQVGVYCEKCGKWNTWLSKAELEFWKSRGLEIQQGQKEVESERTNREQIICKYGDCDSEEFFIQRKGNQKGLYCSECGRWQKWISKKELASYKQRGFEIFEEGEHTTIRANEIHDENHTLTTDNLNLFEKNLKGEEKEEYQHLKEKGVHDIEKDCICRTGQFTTLGINKTLSIFNGKIEILDYRTSEKEAIEIEYCPFCGRKL